MKKIDGKKLLNDYIVEMEKEYELQKQYQLQYMNEELNDEWFDYNKSIRFTRTWDILMNKDEFLIDYPVRNMLLLYNACDCRTKETLEALTGFDTAYKNVSTLRVLITNARKKIRKIYNDKYGVN